MRNILQLCRNMVDDKNVRQYDIVFDLQLQYQLLQNLHIPFFVINKNDEKSREE